MSIFKRLQTTYINGEQVFNFGGLVPGILGGETPPVPSPTPTPTNTATPQPTPTMTGTPTGTPNPTSTPTNTPSNTPQPTPTPTPSSTPPAVEYLILTEGSDSIFTEADNGLEYEHV